MLLSFFKKVVGLATIHTIEEYFTHALCIGLWVGLLFGHPTFCALALPRQLQGSVLWQTYWTYCNWVSYLCSYGILEGTVTTCHNFNIMHYWKYDNVFCYISKVTCNNYASYNFSKPIVIVSDLTYCCYFCF